MKAIVSLLVVLFYGISVDQAWSQSLLPPSITSIIPLRGTVGTTFDATIFGGNLTDATAVSVAGTGVSVTILSGKTATALPVRVSIAKDAALGQRRVTVNAPAGTSSSSQVVLTVVRGGWTATGSLAVDRFDHTATLLQDGKVLVVGGSPNTSPTCLASAEIYNPATAFWSPAGFLATGRCSHRATLLQSGKVLVTGGNGSSGNILSSAELYDPATRTWMSVPSMGSARTEHSATLLPSGKVLISGGYAVGGGPPISSAELFDPQTISWTTQSPMPTGRGRHTATLLRNGKILVAGGNSTADFASTLLFDPSTMTWARTGDLNVPRSAHTATLLLDGRVLVTGGGYPERYTSEIFDPVTETWTRTGLLTNDRIWHTAVLLADGKVLVMGGRPSSTFGDQYDTTESFDPTTGTWTTVDLMNNRRERFASLLLNTNKVLAVGGQQGSISAELFDPVVMVSTGNPVPPSPPLITAVTPATGVIGTTSIVIITGTNLSSATAVTFSGAGISASIGSGATATNLPIVITIAGNAEPGPRTITVSTGAGVSSPFSGFVIEPHVPVLGLTAPQPITEVEQGTVQVGYVVLTPDPNTAAPLTTLTYGTVQNGLVQDQAGITSFGLTTGATLFGDILSSASRNLGLTIANPTSTTNAITITLKNGDGSNVGVPSTINIEPYRQVAKFLSELFSADVLGQSFLGSITIQSTTPFAVLAFPFAGVNFSALPAGNTGTVSGVPTRTLTSGGTDSPRAGTIGGSNALVLPQFALGGGWATKLGLVNNSGSTVMGRIDIIGSDGQPLAVKLNGTTQSTFIYVIPAGGTFVLAPRDLNGQSPL